jgi:hypothetical protein
MRLASRIALVTVVLLASDAARAQTPAAEAPRPGRGSFERGRLGLEFAGTIAPEIWHLNGTHEWVLAGTLATSWAFRHGKQLIVEFHAAPILQDSSRNAFVQAIVPVYRCRLVERARTTVFWEFGAGLSWSDTRVPPRGTRYNYLTATSLGVSRHLSSQIQAVTSVRWLHLSNAGWEGADHNPDIEAIGVFAGIALALTGRR